MLVCMLQNPTRGSGTACFSAYCIWHTMYWVYWDILILFFCLLYSIVVCDLECSMWFWCCYCCPVLTCYCSCINQKQNCLVDLCCHLLEGTSQCLCRTSHFPNIVSNKPQSVEKVLCMMDHTIYTRENGKELWKVDLFHTFVQKCNCDKFKAFQWFHYNNIRL